MEREKDASEMRTSGVGGKGIAYTERLTTLIAVRTIALAMTVDDGVGVNKRYDFALAKKIEDYIINGTIPAGE